MYMEKTSEYVFAKSFEELKEAAEAGKTIQFNLCGTWVDWVNPDFSGDLTDYRFKKEK